MPDTPRTLAALQALLADNVTAEISPQDVRDWLVSCGLVTGTGELAGTADVPTVTTTHSGTPHSNVPTQTAPLDMGGNVINDVGDPVLGGDAVNLDTLLDSIAIAFHYHFLAANVMSSVFSAGEAFEDELITGTPQELTTIFQVSTAADTPTPFTVGAGTLISAHFDAKVLSITGRKPTFVYVQLGYVDADGSSNFVQIGADSDPTTVALTEAKEEIELHIHVAAETNIPAGKRLKVKWWATTTGALPDPTIHIYYGALADHITIPVSASILGNFLPLAGGTMTGIIVMGTNKIQGGAGSGDDLTLESTAHATKGKIILLDAAGIGTTTVPHGAIGIAKLAIDGPTGSALGPHIQTTTDQDDYPVFQLWSWNHDNFAMNMNAYYDGSLWRSSSASANFQMLGSPSALSFKYDTGIAQGGEITWNTGWALAAATGQILLPVQGSGAGLLIGGDAQLYRSAADTLRTPDALIVDGLLTASGGLVVATSIDVSALVFPAWSNTGITGAELETLSDGSDADALHDHTNHGVTHNAAHGISKHTEHANWKLLYTDGSGDEQELALPADGLALVGAGAAAAPVFEALYVSHIISYTAAAEDLAVGAIDGINQGVNVGESGEHGAFTAIRGKATAETVGVGTNTIVIEADDNPAFSSATTLFTLALNTSTEVDDATLDNAWASGDIWVRARCTAVDGGTPPKDVRVFFYYKEQATNF